MSLFKKGKTMAKEEKKEKKELSVYEYQAKRIAEREKAANK